MWEAEAGRDLFADGAGNHVTGPRPVSADLAVEDLDIERGLRPQTLEDYCGQSRVKENLRVLIDAASSRNEPLDHVLFSGPPGLGKTTLAAVVANEMGGTLHTTSGPAITRPVELSATLTNLGEGDVLFIDEIHRLSRNVEEILYSAMEDFFLDIIMGDGPGARSMRFEIPPFTLVGATTRTGLLTGPLRDRFGISYRLDYYTVEELTQIVLRSAGILGVDIDLPGAQEVASRSRGTPRLANRLLKRVRDYAQVRAQGTVTWQVAAEALDRRAGARLDGHQDPACPGRDVPRPRRGAVHPGERGGGGPLHHRGGLRAVPAPAGAHGPHAPGAPGDPGRLRAPVGRTAGFLKWNRCRIGEPCCRETTWPRS